MAIVLSVILTALYFLNFQWKCRSQRSQGVLTPNNPDWCGKTNPKCCISPPVKLKGEIREEVKQ